MASPRTGGTKWLIPSARTIATAAPFAEATFARPDWICESPPDSELVAESNSTRTDSAASPCAAQQEGNCNDGKRRFFGRVPKRTVSRTAQAGSEAVRHEGGPKRAPEWSGA